MFASIIVIAASCITEHNNRNEALNNLPKDIADEIRAKDAEMARDSQLHQRALDIANASRARNIWGE